jgi:hypothetical protein
VNYTGSGLSAAELYDPATETWSATASLNMARLNHFAVLLRDGSVLAGAGTDGTNALSSAELYRTNAFATTITLTNPKLLPNGSFQFAFTNTPGALFEVLGGTDATLPVNAWTRLGQPTEVSSGQFQFTDGQTTSVPGRFYSVLAQ